MAIANQDTILSRSAQMQLAFGNIRLRPETSWGRFLMAFRIPQQPSEARPSRRLILERMYPKAGKSFGIIEQTREPMRYGQKRSAVLTDYHFQSLDWTRAYFEHYLELRHGNPPDEDLLHDYVDRTINRLLEDFDNTPNGAANSFELFISDLIEEIEDSRSGKLNGSPNNKPILRFIIGSTGSGKTAYSKAMFTVGLGVFWDNAVIPTRVEYSKITSKISDTSGKQTLTSDLYDYVRWCQLRDLLLYLCGSGNWELSEQKALIDELSIKGVSSDSPELRSLWKELESRKIDGERLAVDDLTLTDFYRIYGSWSPQQIQDVLYSLHDRIGGSFLISFDGFDAININDFFFDDVPNVSAIDKIAVLVRELWEDRDRGGLHLKPVDAHYLVYLRDTSFERLRTSLIKGVGDSKDIPTLWIVPPKYEQLVNNAAKQLTGQASPSKNQSKQFSDDTFQAFDTAIFRKIDGLSAQDHLSFVFASNARQMKRQIVSSLFWALNRTDKAFQGGSLDQPAGANPSWLWKELVKSHALANLPSYVTLEGLYLNKTRQLFPTLQINFPRLSRYLGDKDYQGALTCVQDRDEIIASYGCVLNYFLTQNLFAAGEPTRLPQLLLLVRALQYIDFNHGCQLDEVFEFLMSLGYGENEPYLRFTLYLLMRNQTVGWNSAVGGKVIDVCPLYITTKGRVFIRHLLFTVTYVSEAMLNSVQCDPSFYGMLTKRDFSSIGQEWVVDCIRNASLYLTQVTEIEDVEMENAEKHNINFSPYVLSREIRSSLGDEVNAILSAADRVTLNRHHQHVQFLEEKLKSYGQIQILGRHR